MISREEVYKAVDSERSYQEEINPTRINPQSLVEYLVVMRHHINEALKTCCNGELPSSALEHLRMTTAYGVQCMEVHGAPRRWRPDRA